MVSVLPWLGSHLEPRHSVRLQLRGLNENCICHHKLIFWTLDECPGNNFYGISLIGPVIPAIMIGQGMWESAWGREREPERWSWHKETSFDTVVNNRVFFLLTYSVHTCTESNACAEPLRQLFDQLIQSLKVQYVIFSVENINQEKTKE